jgi:hypothetical protein
MNPLFEKNFKCVDKTIIEPLPEEYFAGDCNSVFPGTTSTKTKSFSILFITAGNFRLLKTLN